MAAPGLVCDATWLTSPGRKLALSFTFENVRKGFRGIAPKFIAIPWRPRVYLVPADDVIGFCNEVNAGAEPRTDMHGEYLLREGDERKEVSGDPELPAEYRDCLLKAPVEATVLDIRAFTLRPSVSDWNVRGTPLTLARTEATRCEALMVQDDKDAAPQVGWRVLTRPRWRALSAK